MSIDVNSKDGISHLSINDEMTIYTATAMKNELVDKLCHCHEMEISLENVSEIDSAGVQILIALRQEAAQLKKEMRFVKHSAAVLDVFETLNLAAHFGDPIVLPAGGKSQ
ncbi:STAS domain-containing protein [Enterovibrio paralichthyis]|uniref:STAS domain-containing protein n=1 Tax=Enterovibrio paralichthyis TaxID=2853805 RepID=UPI001C48E8C6|nr:STAS domain-containing protein [Enterovibrio paralichthyis]MBV7296958.1 STAS domain-containing protein [Enterovibrio paralichthyis]